MDYGYLFWSLFAKNITLRYKQALFGIAWAILRPLCIIGIFTFLFTTIIPAPSLNAVPYFLLVATGLIPWNFFAIGITEASTSLITNQNLISNTHIPRILFPLSAIAVHFVECIIALCIIIILGMYYGIYPTTSLLALPFFLICLLVLTIGIGTGLASANVRYRDINHFLPVLLQAGILISPIGFVSTIVPEQFKYIFFMNPLADIIEGFRWSILHGGTMPSRDTILIACIIAIGISSIGITYFRKTEDTMADFL